MENREELRVLKRKKRVRVVDDSLSAADPLSEWHPLSEAYSLLSGLRNPRRGSVRDVLTQRVASPPSEVVVPSRA